MRRRSRMDRHLGDLPLVRRDLTQRAGEDQNVERQPQEVAGVDPLRVERREQEVVEPREGGEGGGRGEPAHQLVSGFLRPPREPDRRDRVKNEADHLGHEQTRLANQVRARGVRRKVGIDPDRQVRLQRGARNPDHEQRGEHHAERLHRRAPRSWHRRRRDHRSEGKPGRPEQPPGDRRPGVESARLGVHDPGHDREEKVRQARAAAATRPRAAPAASARGGTAPSTGTAQQAARSAWRPSRSPRAASRSDRRRS